jgi:hypothetical protein
MLNQASNFEGSGMIVEDIKDIKTTDISAEDLNKALFSAGEAKPDPTATHLISKDGMAEFKEPVVEAIEKKQDAVEPVQKKTLTDILSPEQSEEKIEEVKTDEPVKEDIVIEQVDYSQGIPTEVQDKIVAPYLAKIEELENKLVADAEYQKDKLAFLAKYSPEDFKLEPKFYVQEKLKEEFGEEFKPDANDALIYGTPSYNFVERQKELVAEAKNYQGIAKGSISESMQKAQDLLNEARTTVKNEYGLSDEDFNAIDKSISEMSNKDAYRIVFEGQLAKNELAKKTAGLKTSNERSKIPPSVQDIGAGKIATESVEDKQLAAFFGDRWKKGIAEGKIKVNGIAN